MAFFKFWWPSSSDQADKPAKRSRTSQAESIEAMRRRARHRLIGAAVLVLLGVVGFPLLFDTQPRPISVDIPIEIPDRNKTTPLVAPVPVASTPISRSSTQASSSAAIERPSVGLDNGEEFVAAHSMSSPETVLHPASVASIPQPQVLANSSPTQALSTAEPAKPVRPNDAASARGLAQNRAVSSQTARAPEGRFIVQVGAFAEPEKAREARSKVERAGLKTYTQVVDTHDGKRTRVRVGPFTQRAEADKAAARIKTLDLPASVLAL